MQAATRPSRPFGTRRSWRRRLLFHHAPLALASAAVLALFVTVPIFDSTRYHHVADISSNTFPRPSGMEMDATEMGASIIHRSTVATGYIALGLLGLTLLIGPANLLVRRRNPVSTYLRRDMGTWTAVVSVVHVILAFGVDAGGQILHFFVRDGRPLLNSFGLGNWIGLAALVLVVVLLALSTDSAMRDLKARAWKDLQRLNYTLFALVILHAFFYGALVRMTSPFTLLLLLTLIAVVAGQAVGIWLWRRRSSRTGRGFAEERS